MRRSDGVKVDRLDGVEEVCSVQGTDDVSRKEATEGVARDGKPLYFSFTGRLDGLDMFADLERVDEK